MNGKVSMFLGSGLLACSMLALAGPPANPAADAPAATTPAAATTSSPSAWVVIQKLPPPTPKDRGSAPPPRFCHLGQDCMALDARPFEICQVSGKSCGDKLAEFLRVQQPQSDAKPAPPLVFTSR